MKVATLTTVLALASAAMGQAKIPVTGVPSGNGAVPLRQNINTLANSGAQWDLYIQALQAMMKFDSHDPTSYFQVAGIHGEPYIPWDNAGARQGDGWLGYCPHGENLFISWHRPYVLLYEQILVNTAKTIANGYPAKYRAQYQAAAASLRAPYWDWAAENHVPASTVPNTLRINVPNGNNLQTVDFVNPLRTFWFPHISLSGSYGPFSPGNDHTIRCPSPQQNYPNTANANIQSRPYKQWVYDCLTQSVDFNDFASTAGPGINFEQVHNAIHWDGACGNQFLSPDYSGFDPLFMLHHAQVDRIWAYWEALKPEAAVFSGSYAGQSRYATRTGTQISANSPLQPFFQSNGQFHTTNTVKNLQGLGYSYQGLEYWQKSPAQMKTSATQLINQLYGAGTTSTSKRDGSHVKTRYFVKLSVDVAQVPRPAEINVFVSGQKAGSIIVMMLPATGIVNGGFTVDQPFQTISKKHGAQNAVSAFSDGLSVQIVKKDGTVIPVTQVPSLTVTLETVNVTLPANDDELPVIGHRQRHTAFAHSKGGLV